jgi:hypothetical protein
LVSPAFAPLIQRHGPQVCTAKVATPASTTQTATQP